MARNRARIGATCISRRDGADSAPPGFSGGSDLQPRPKSATKGVVKGAAEEPSLPLAARPPPSLLASTISGPKSGTTHMSGSSPLL